MQQSVNSSGGRRTPRAARIHVLALVLGTDSAGVVRQTFRRGGDAGSVGGGLFGEDIRVCVEISVNLAKIIATLLPTLIK